ncbi:hypothetical protein [Teredinibacter purpureus]|uniref:hypothetical protein n=1 Tax=Teredinibacter purpureus TaxID=2731756 RepID=UPI0013C4B0A6|nr:hypothetical protein [Teredinibacter purpureus]
MVKFYDPNGNFTYQKSLSDVDAYSQSIKNHFYFGGYALVDGERIGSHNTLASLQK